MSCFGELLEADVLTLIQQNAADADAADTCNLAGGGTTTIQAILDVLCECLLEIETVTATTAVGDNTIQINAPAGFTTANIVGTVFRDLSGNHELDITDTVSDSGSIIVYRLSGVEVNGGGHELTATFIKPKNA